MSSVAYFVTPHGYGHAARACAVMEELTRLREDIHLAVFTTVPRWFFSESLSMPFEYHVLATDVGLVQKTSLEEDPEGTVERLQRLLPPEQSVLDTTVGQLLDSDVRTVVCDIAPVGLLAARRARLRSVLVENFTWDWIYRAYVPECPELAAQVSRMAEIFDSAEIRVQTDPVCSPLDDARHVAPVSRRPRCHRRETRHRLGIPDSAPMVLLTMGGVHFDFGNLRALSDHPRAFFVVPGGAETAIRSGHLIALPHHSEYYHPDLVHASDLVIGKVGYSTVAEVYHSQAAFAYVTRPRFPESRVLAEFVSREMAGIELRSEELAGWQCLDHLDEFLASRSTMKPRANGAADVAKIILGAVHSDR